MPRLGVEGRLVIAFTMAGGVMAGGLLVATATIADRISASVLPPATLVLFVAGSVLGWLHAVLLGYAGRATGSTRLGVVGHILAGGAWSLPALLLALLAAFGMGLTGILLQTGGAFALLTIAVSWLVGGAICVWAVVVGVEAFRNAVARYPEARLGLMLLGVVLLILLIAFERTRPSIWGSDAEVTALGAAILALGATLWIGAPVLFSILHVLYARQRRASQSRLT